MHIFHEQVFFINKTLKDTYPLFNASWWSVWEKVYVLMDGWSHMPTPEMLEAKLVQSQKKNAKEKDPSSMSLP